MHHSTLTQMLLSLLVMQRLYLLHICTQQRASTCCQCCLLKELIFLMLDAAQAISLQVKLASVMLFRMIKFCHLTGATIYLLNPQEIVRYIRRVLCRLLY
jgi:hypothetical protein